MRTIHGGWMLLLLSAGAAVLGCGGSVEVNSGGGGAGGETTSSTVGTGGSGGTSGTTIGTGGVAGGTGGTTITTTTVTTTTTTVVPGGPQALAIHKLRLGDTLPNGNPSSTAWQQYGLNIDGKISTAQSVDLCKPAAGAKASAIYPDGQNGIDNSFGKNVLPIMTSLTADFSTQVNDAINQGRNTVLLRIQGIAPGQVGTFATQLFTGAFPGGQFPSWQGNDAWPIRSDCLVNGNPATPKTEFPNATVSVDPSGARIWDSGSVGDIDLTLSFSGFDLTLPIRHARIVTALSDDNAHATSGMIGGVLDTEAYIAELAKLAGSFDPSLCPPSTTFESIAQQVRQANDILLDGSQDPGKTCDGISIGLGFDADGALLGDVFVPAVAPNPCQ